MEFAIAQAVLDYNVGYQEGSIISDLGEPFNSLHKSYLERNDNIREKLWRKKKKMQTETDDRSDYAAGGF